MKALAEFRVFQRFPEALFQCEGAYLLRCPCNLVIPATLLPHLACFLGFLELLPTGK